MALALPLNSCYLINFFIMRTFFAAHCTEWPFYVRCWPAFRLPWRGVTSPEICGRTSAPLGRCLFPSSASLPSALALSEPIGVAVHFESVDVMGLAIQQSAAQPLGAKDASPFVEGQVAGHDGGGALVTLIVEDLEQQLGASL